MHEGFGRCCAILKPLKLAAGVKSVLGARDEWPYIFDLFDGEVGVCWYADFLWLNIYDD